MEDISNPLLLVIILFWLFATILWSAISVTRHADCLAIKFVANKQISFKVDGSTYPNWTGTEQKRDVSKYSPLQNVRPATPYPAILLIAAERDERIAPVHSLKLAAAFQSTQGSSAPVLLRVDRDLGAVEAAPMRHLIDLAADRLTLP